MCGRVFQSSPPADLGLGLVEGLEAGFPGAPRYNGAPGQDLLVIRRNPETHGCTLDPLRWGLIPSWAKSRPKPPPINARAETVARLPMFRAAYAKRRCILPIDGFYEWKAAEAGRAKDRAKQPYAIAMANRRPFGLAALWENWQEPGTEAWTRTFCVLTTQANSLVGDIHDRMPVILPPEAYARWLGPDPDPADLLAPFPPEPMAAWPASTRVNQARLNEPGLINSL